MAPEKPSFAEILASSTIAIERKTRRSCRPAPSIEGVSRAGYLVDRFETVAHQIKSRECNFLLFGSSFLLAARSPASFRKMLLHQGISFDEVRNIFAHGECLETGMSHDDLAKLLRSVLLVPVIFFNEMRGECSEIRLCRAAISFVAKLVPRSARHRSIILFIFVVR
jgi:hypothetical protein